MLARAFAQHNDELELFLQRERCFVGDAGHELRTPLAIISGAAETLVHQLPADSHLVSVADRVVRTTQEMQRQLTCLLLLSRDPQTLPLANVSLHPLLEECMDRCKPWLAKKTVTLSLDAPQQVQIFTCVELARSVVWNLLRNACQYTVEGEVRLTLHDTTLTISDTGPGLPSSVDPDHFERFQSGSRQNGEGLGLSIVQRIVEHLGWQMKVESSERGCCFTLEIDPISTDEAVV
ncbi:Swarming motility regulation sensor protein RssA [compost metagenome]